MAPWLPAQWGDHQGICRNAKLEQAERNARKKEAEADPTRVDQAQPRRSTVKDAIRMFLEDEEARGLEHSSRKKSRTLFERQFLPFVKRASSSISIRLCPSI
jgi:hypothetical protein